MPTMLFYLVSNSGNKGMVVFENSFNSLKNIDFPLVLNN